jgi:ribosomal protein S18 acetylase RimI-like enzyme
MHDLLQLQIRQILGAWKIMSAGCSDARCVEAEGAEYVFSGLPIPFFNVVVPTELGISASRLSQIGSEACAFAQETGLPWLFVPTLEALNEDVDAEAALSQCGLVPTMGMTAMIAEKISDEQRRPDGLEIIIPSTDDTCREIVHLNSAAYGMDLSSSLNLLGSADFWTGHTPAVGLADGIPVSTASVLHVEGLRYVALVATPPQHQRRGFADAVMRHALQVSAEKLGETRTLLHATDAGRPVYERMGYRAVASTPIYMERRFLEEHAQEE